MDTSAKEFDLGINYKVDDNIAFNIKYGKYTIDNTENQTNVKLTLKVIF